MVFLAVCLLVVVLVAAGLHCLGPRSAPPGATMADLHGVADLQARVNADRGQTRLVVIFSPTSTECRHGAGLVQSKILKAHPTAHLRVYAIWVDKLFGDARNRWDAAGLTDPRVVHLWDAQDVSGDWLVDHVRGYQGGDWDTDLLFGPDASWTSQPGPLASSGSPVNHQIDDLRQAMNPLLATS